MRKLIYGILSVLIVSGWPVFAANIPTSITYQGTLRTGGIPADGDKTMQFRITNQDGTAVYWSGSNQTVHVNQGLFTTTISPTGVDWQNVTPYIEVSVEGQVLSPREPINTSVYAFMSNNVIDGVITQVKLSASVQQGLIPIGTILPFAGQIAPAGFLLCDGSRISRISYSNLFGVIGTIWGSGDRSSTFNLPDLRGRATIGAGQGSGLTNRTLGDTSIGEEMHTLDLTQIPSHNHGVNDPGHVHPPMTAGQTFLMEEPGSPFNTTSSGETAVRTVGSTGSALTGITIQNSGGGAPHNIMQPSAVVNYIIKY